MAPIPWRQVNSWKCVECGICCNGFKVMLKLNEWLNLVQTFGMNVVQPSIGQLCLGKKMDGTCAFLYQLSGRWRCGLQQMKPKACKMWPFKILGKPKYGNSHEASFNYRDRVFYVYIDPICIGTRWGTPSQGLMQKTLPEFVDIGLGIKEKQYYSTSKIPYIQPFRL